MENNFDSVFECNPNAQEIYVVNGMPFLNASHAQSHSVTTGQPVTFINRPSVKGEQVETLAAAEKAAKSAATKATKAAKAAEKAAKS